jgi:hypothetical protein
MNRKIFPRISQQNRIPRPGAPSIAPLSHAMGGMNTAQTTSPCRCLFSVVAVPEGAGCPIHRAFVSCDGWDEHSPNHKSLPLPVLRRCSCLSGGSSGPGAPSIASLSHAMGGMYTARTTSPCRCLFSVVAFPEGAVGFSPLNKANRIKGL